MHCVPTSVSHPASLNHFILASLLGPRAKAGVRVLHLLSWTVYASISPFTQPATKEPRVGKRETLRRPCP